MKKVAIALCAASLLFGASKYEYELTPLIGYGHSSEGTKDEGFFGARIAKNLDLPWLTQIELGAEYAPRVKYKDDGYHTWGNWGYWGLPYEDHSDKTDIFRVYVDLVKLWEVTDKFGIYGLLGVGYQHFQHSADKAENGGFAQAGLGLRFALTDQVALKLEARELVGFKHGKDKQLYTLGLGIGLGERAVEMPAAEPVIGDEDGDGVLDNVDRCPGTPKGHVVDEWGCEKVIRLDLGVNFAFDSDKIKPEYEAKIREVSDLLVANPDYRVILEGHTDSVGSDAYNQKLSERRAIAVAKVLQAHGVTADRISTTGFGKTQPIADNSTAEGRAQNRRVDAKFRK